MLLLGLTGSIATGKSTVSNLLRAEPYNLPVIDADVLARKVVEPGTPGYKKIVDYFGPSTPDLLLPPEDALCGGKENGKDGKGRPLNRPALGRRVFGMSEERVRDRKVLNGIVHPAVGKAIYRAIVGSMDAILEDEDGTNWEYSSITLSQDIGRLC
jgi:dephospho-CoA kinase